MTFERPEDAEVPATSRVNVGHVERWLSLVAGGALAAYGLKRRAVPGGTAALAGAALLYRGATGHCELYQALGVNRGYGPGMNRNSPGTDRPGTGRHGTGLIADRESDTRQQLGGTAGIHVEEAITIHKPVEEVYRFWRNFENLPRFMNHLESVSVREAGTSHWIACGPPGMKAEWDARLINEIDNKLIAWQSLDGSTISTAGSVNFRRVTNGTRVRVHLQYNPPAGKLGAAVAWLFGEEPTIQVREDLDRFKQLMETGEIERSERSPKIG